MALRISRAAGWTAVVALAAGAAAVTTPDATPSSAPVVVQVAQARNAIAPLAPQQASIDRLLMTAPR